MLRDIITPLSHVRLDNVPSIQIRHFAILLDPHLVSRVWRDHIQRRDVDPELARLGELSNAGAQRQKVWPRDRGSQIGYRETHVVNSGAVEAEHMAVVGVIIVRRWRGNKVVERAAGVVGELRKERLRLLFRKGAHLGTVAGYEDSERPE